MRWARGHPRLNGPLYVFAADAISPRNYQLGETTARPAMAARQPSRRAAATAAAEAAAVAEAAAAAEGGGGGGGGGGEAKRLWSKHRATLALVTRVKPSQAAPIEALTTPRLAKLREQRTVHDLFAGIDNNPDHSMEEEHSKTQSSALPAELSLPEERGLAQLELSPGFAPLRRVARRGKSSAQAEAASLEVLASEQRKSSKRLQRVVRSTSRSLLDEGISMGEIYASKQACGCICPPSLHDHMFAAFDTTYPALLARLRPGAQQAVVRAGLAALGLARQQLLGTG